MRNVGFIIGVGLVFLVLVVVVRPSVTGHAVNYLRVSKALEGKEDLYAKVEFLEKEVQRKKTVHLTVFPGTVCGSVNQYVKLFRFDEEGKRGALMSLKVCASQMCNRPRVVELRVPSSLLPSEHNAAYYSVEGSDCLGTFRKDFEIV